MVPRPTSIHPIRICFLLFGFAVAIHHRQAGKKLKESKLLISQHDQRWRRWEQEPNGLSRMNATAAADMHSYVLCHCHTLSPSSTLCIYCQRASQIEVMMAALIRFLLPLPTLPYYALKWTDDFDILFFHPKPLCPLLSFRERNEKDIRYVSPAICVASISTRRHRFRLTTQVHAQCRCGIEFMCEYARRQY